MGKNAPPAAMPKVARLVDLALLAQGDQVEREGAGHAAPRDRPGP